MVLGAGVPRGRIGCRNVWRGAARARWIRISRSVRGLLRAAVSRSASGVGRRPVPSERDARATISLTVASLIVLSAAISRRDRTRQSTATTATGWQFGLQIFSTTSVAFAVIGRPAEDWSATAAAMWRGDALALQRAATSRSPKHRRHFLRRRTRISPRLHPGRAERQHLPMEIPQYPETESGSLPRQRHGCCWTSSRRSTRLHRGA